MAVRKTVIRGDGAKAQAVLRFAGVVKDGETITIGPHVFEYCARDVAHVNPGNIRMNIAQGVASGAVKAQGTLTLPTIPVAGDTMTIGSKTYTFTAPGGATLDGQIDIGANVAATKLAIVAAIKGTDGHNTTHPQVDCASAFSGNDLVITALVAGTSGNSIATTETFTPSGDVFDAATLGTTTAGADATAEDGADAFVAAFPPSARVKATKISANEVLVEAVDEGPFNYLTTETMSTTNNMFSASQMFGGLASGVGISMLHISRVPTATEVALGNMHFPIDFEPKFVSVFVYTTSTGLQVLWNGKATIKKTGPKYRVTLDNSGSIDWSQNETISLLVLG